MGEVLLPEAVIEKLKQAARGAAQNSYSPYSHFPVGAAALAPDGSIYTGTNVENSSYGLTLCAERVALVCAVTSGERRVKVVAIYTDTDEPQPPCGACLQVISEFADGNTPILMFTENKEHRSTLERLLPLRFKLNPKER